MDTNTRIRFSKALLTDQQHPPVEFVRKARSSTFKCAPRVLYVTLGAAPFHGEFEAVTTLRCTSTVDAPPFDPELAAQLDCKARTAAGVA